MPEAIPRHQWENYEVRPEPARRGAARNLSDLHFPLLRSWQKRRFFARGAQPAETKLMSDKRAGARLVDRRSTRRVPSRDG
jgi:hypothetical protein